MKKSTVLKNLLLSYDYLDKASASIDVDADESLIDQDIDVDIVESIMMMRDIIKKIDAKEYKRIMREAAIGG